MWVAPATVDAVSTSTPLAHKPVLTGERALLRPFTPADIDAMGPVLADPDVQRLTGSVHSTAEAGGADPVLDDTVRRWYETRAEQTDRLDLALVDRATDRCVGEVVLNHWEPENQACNFRILIGPEGRDRGLGSEATAVLRQRRCFASHTPSRSIAKVGC